MMSVVYSDDIFNFFSCSQEEHIVHVSDVLHRRLKNKLFVKAKKCEFHAKTVGFLGYVVEKGVLRADPAKVETVTRWPATFPGVC